MQSKQSTIAISEHEATTLVYLLQKHLRHCDHILGENHCWPKERAALARLLSRINRAFGDCSWIASDLSNDANKPSTRIY